MKRGGPVIAGIAVAGLILAASASAKTFEVTRTADTAPDGCSETGCTLREAVLAANARAGSDVVLLKPGRGYDLTIQGTNEDAGLDGDLDVSDALTARTAGKAPATITAEPVSGEPAFHATAALALEQLVLNGSGVNGEGGGIRLAKVRVIGSGFSSGIGQSGPGGLTMKHSAVLGGYDAIFEGDDGDVRLVDSRIAGAGGDPIVESGGGRVVLSDSELEGNASGAVVEQNDGGVELDRSRIDGSPFTAILELDTGGVELRRSRLTGGGGGGLSESGDGGVGVSRSRVTGNGGIGVSTSTAGRLTVTRSTISGNSRGLFVDGGAVGVVTSSTISGNEGDDGGAGIQVRPMAELTVRGATIANNTTEGVSGGGILVDPGGTLTVTNSTIAGNRAFLSGGGIRIDGPGTTATLNGVTIARNTANYTGFSMNSGGGGLNANNGATFDVRNSLIALNTAFGAFGPDCYANLGSGGHNLLSDDSDCSGMVGSDLVRSIPKLGSLERNGGPTATIALKKGSPAIGKAGNDAPGKDQRGQKRDKNPDIGAFER